MRVWGQDGQALDWSEPAAVEAGLLETGRLGGPVCDPRLAGRTAPDRPAPMLRREFTLRAGIRQARLYHRAGVYEAQLNGRPVGDQCWRPAGPATTTACATRPMT